MKTDNQIVIAALYKFWPQPEYEALREPLLATCEQAGTKGTLLLASEGINGTIAGSRGGVDAVLAHIRSIPGFEDLEHKESFDTENPFLRMKVRLKKEIVTMGVPETDPNHIVGTYVDPQDWDDLISGALYSRDPSDGVLLIYDEDDQVVDPRQGDIIQKLWPSSQLVNTRELGHSRVLWDAAVVDRIADFVAEPHPDVCVTS